MKVTDWNNRKEYEDVDAVVMVDAHRFRLDFYDPNKDSIFVDASEGILICDEIINTEWMAISECLDDAQLKGKKFPDQWNNNVLPGLIEKVKKIMLRVEIEILRPKSTLPTYAEEFQL